MTPKAYRLQQGEKLLRMEGAGPPGISCLHPVPSAGTVVTDSFSSVLARSWTGGWVCAFPGPSPGLQSKKAKTSVSQEKCSFTHLGRMFVCPGGLCPCFQSKCLCERSPVGGPGDWLTCFRRWGLRLWLGPKTAEDHPGSLGL